MVMEIMVYKKLKFMFKNAIKNVLLVTVAIEDNVIHA